MSDTRALTANKLKIKIYASRLEMGRQAAADTAAAIRSLLAKQDTVNIIFAAAPSQNEFLNTLSEDKSIDWTRVNAFHMDEYTGLPEDAPQRFGNFLKEKIFGKLPFHNVFYIDGNAPDPQRECDRYSDLLKQHPTHIICMGIGENTHIAFNDPHVADFNDPVLVKLVELSAVSRRQQVHDGCFATEEQVPTTAITLTIPALMRADLVFCMVPGTNKARAVYHTVRSAIQERYPSTILREHDCAILYLDKDSASELDAGTAVSF